MTAPLALTALVCLAVGVGAGWLARGRVLASRAAAPLLSPGEPVPLTVTATVTMPLVAFGEPIVGVGIELQGLLRSDVEPRAGDGGGADPATGLPWNGDPGDVPDGEQ